MSQPRTTVLKIGGSVITDKNGELVARTQVMSRLADEIRRVMPQRLIVVHGGGSFGHPVAEKHHIKEGFKEPSQLPGFAETHHVMTMLNGLFMDELILQDVPAVSIAPSSCIVTEDGRIKDFPDASVKRLLNLGFVPVLYGDAVLDTKLGFTILSGDQLTAMLALNHKAERVVIGVDVDGLFDSDPKAEKTAKMFPRLSLKEVRKFQHNLGGSTGHDVTGGMSGKIAELIPVVERGIPVTIVNASEPDFVYRALKGERVKSTLIERE